MDNAANERFVVYGKLAPSAGKAYATARAARQAADRLDNKYGAYAHTVVRFAPGDLSQFRK